MKQLTIAFGLALACTSAYAQPPDGTNASSSHRPGGAGASTSSGLGQTRAGAVLSQQAGLLRSGERSPWGAAAFSSHVHGRASHVQRDSSIRANSTRGDGEQLGQASKPADDSERGKGKPMIANWRAREIAKKLTGHERALQVQLATADRMRDRALETSDVKMLERADKFEQKARARFAEQARSDAKALGKSTAEQARNEGHEFGQSNADQTRLLPAPPPVAAPIPAPANDPTPDTPDEPGSETVDEPGSDPSPDDGGGAVK